MGNSLACFCYGGGRRRHVAPAALTSDPAYDEGLVHSSADDLVADAKAAASAVEPVGDADKHPAPLLRHHDVDAVLAGFPLRPLKTVGIAAAGCVGRWRRSPCELRPAAASARSLTSLRFVRPSNGPEKKPLTFELVSQYFCMPIKQAAQELNVGHTLLKKRCRDLGISRWPHRKVKSLQTLIKNIQELGKETGGDEDWTRIVVEMLQQTKKLMEERPDVMLDEKTKILRRNRQACFKENFKRRKLMALEG